MTSAPRRAAAVVTTCVWLTMVGGLAVSCSSDSSSTTAPTASVASSATPDTASPSPAVPTTAAPTPSPTDDVSDAVDSPVDASVADFCAANSAADAPATDGTARAARATVEALRRVGTPADIPAAARAGFLVLLAVVEAIPDGATADEVKRAGTDLAPSDQAKVVAYFTYAAKTCPT